MIEKKNNVNNLQAATEGAVLIKNEGDMLPVKSDETVAVFGRHQFEYYRSGTGSGGSVQVAYTTNIIEELIKNGVLVNEGLVEVYREWLQQNPPDDGGGGWAAEPWFQEDMPLKNTMVKQIHKVSKKAIYVIGRTAGEDQDNKFCEGSYYFGNILLAMNRNHIVLKWILYVRKGHCVKSISNHSRW